MEETKQIDSEKFPNIYYGVAGEFAELYSNYLESPKEFFFMAYLTCLGSAISGRIKVETELKTQPRFYTILLGQSADDRKTTAINKAVDFFKETISHFNICNGIGSAEGLQKKLDRLDEPKQLLLCYDEFYQFVSKCKIEGSVLLPCVNSLFDNDFYENQTKKNEYKNSNIQLSLLAASTTETYNQIWDSRFTRIGFNNRLFLVPAQSTKLIAFPDRIPDEDKKEIKYKTGEILSFINKQDTLIIDLDAKQAFEQWYINRKKSIHSKRVDEYMRRLMVVFAANESKEKINLEIVKKAIALGEWQIAVRQIHDPIDADNKMASLEESIRRVLKRKPRKENELKQAVNANRSGLWIYDMAKKNLQKANEITFNTNIKKWEFIGD